MGEITNREIAVILFQYSVVIKGIERKLEEMEYRVTTISENIDQEVARLAGRVALVLFYLPADVNEDKVKLKILQNISETIEKAGQKMALIGEDKYKADVLKEVPGFRKHPWIDRPVDMDVLEDTVIKEINRTQEPEKKGRILIVDDDPSYAKIIRECRDRMKAGVWYLCRLSFCQYNSSSA